MSEMILFVQTYSQTILTGIFWLVLLVLLVNQLRLLRRTKRLQKSLDGIVGKVREYLAVVMEAEEAGEEPEHKLQAEGGMQDADRSEEENSRIISAMLQEIFP
ncbi:MAG: hypothetical protein NC355_08260 [Blautia sp.]|nr:hypothetical protein [Blautia sp.]